jgi:L-iditol 2-dehydrogenase
VERVGAAVRTLRPGDRVAFDPALACGECRECRDGRPHTCVKGRFLGCPGQIEGCLSEYFLLPASNCLQIPDAMTLEEAALVEPLSIAVYATSLCKQIEGATVAVLGAGPIGLCVLFCALDLGAERVYVTDKIEARLEAARRAGAQWTGNPLLDDVVGSIARFDGQRPDVIFECCGRQEATDQAVEVLKPGGELSLIGIPEPNRISFDINLLRRKELRIQNVRRQNHCMQRALALIASGRVDAASLITHRFAFDHTPEAFDLVANYRDGVIKALICIE